MGIYRRELFDKKIYLIEKEIGKLMSLPPTYLDNLDMDQVVRILKNNGTAVEKSKHSLSGAQLLELNSPDQNESNKGKEMYIASKIFEKTSLSDRVRKVVNLFWQKLEFSDAQIEKRFNEWRNRRFIAYMKINFALNIVLAIMHAFVDIVSFCQEGAYRQSFILCNNVDSVKNNSGIFLRNQRLIVITSTLGIGYAFFYLPWLKSRPEVTQWFVVLISLVIGIYWR